MLDDAATTANSPLVMREGRKVYVELDRDHPGFRDPEYRSRRNRIAQIAAEYEPGSTVPDAPYTETEDDVWRVIRANLTPSHKARACKPYLQAAESLDFPSGRIPQLEEVSLAVHGLSGFRFEPVGGLVHAKVFLSAMSEGVFLSTQYIRHHSSPSYTPEPDVVHELIGHAVQLGNPRFAQLSKMFGRAARKTNDGDRLTRLSRVYWYTLEFGAVKEGEHTKAYGSGLLSSYGELEAMAAAEHRPLDFREMEETPYDPTGYQPLLFVAPSFDDLERELAQYLDVPERSE